MQSRESMEDELPSENTSSSPIWVIQVAPLGRSTPVGCHCPWGLPISVIAYLNDLEEKGICMTLQ